jgi:hypothetical protein
LQRNFYFIQDVKDFGGIRLSGGFTKICIDCLMDIRSVFQDPFAEEPQSFLSLSQPFGTELWDCPLAVMKDLLG